MADRQKFCVGIMSLLILFSAGYLGYYVFVNGERGMIDKHNRVRFYIFFGQHFIVLAMMFTFLTHSQEQDRVVRWMFQLSLLVMMAFIGGQVFVVARGGRVFGSRMRGIDDVSQAQEAILQFELNQITLYFQIMTDFALFFIVTGVAMLILRFRQADTEERYEFMIENLKSEDFVDEPNVVEKKGCAICLTDLETERVIKLPCEHFFHKECLVNWLRRSTVCPMCRNDIEESLAPNSPQRYPPARSQPILLPLPQPLQNATVSNPLIRPRQIISLNGRNRLNDSPNQNQQNSRPQNNQRPQNNRYLIFERPLTVNQNRRSLRQLPREVTSSPQNIEVSIGRRIQGLRQSPQPEQRANTTMRQEVEMKNQEALARAVTQRRERYQQVHPSALTALASDEPEKKPIYLNPNQNIQYPKQQENFNLQKTNRMHATTNVG